MAAQQIGIVTQVVGQVVAVNADGVERVLVVGDVVYADEVIRTADAGAVTIQFNDGGWFDLGRNAQAVLDSDVYSPEGHEAVAAVATAKVEDIQAAIQAGGDPTQLLPPTAAGAAAGGPGGGEGGHSFVALDHDFVSINPEAGIPTAAEPLLFSGVDRIIVPVEEKEPAPPPPPPPPPVDNPVAITGLTPSVAGGDVSVNEAHLPDGSNPNPPALTQTGTFTISAPDGLGSLAINGVVVLNAGGLTGNVVTTPLGNSVVVTGYNSDTGVVTYQYTLLDNEAHPLAQGTNNLFEDLPVVLTDSDGDAASDVLAVRIVDDVPQAVSDVDEVTTGASTGGNVITGVDDDAVDAVLADVQGADRAVPVTGVVAGASLGSPITDGAGVGVAVDGLYGKLVLHADGSYTYTANPGITSNVQDVFTYTITDADGDTSTANLTLQVAGEAPPPPPPPPTVGEPSVATDIEGPYLVVKEDVNAVYHVTATTVDATDQITQITVAGLPVGAIVSGSDGGSYDSGSGIYTVSGVQQTVTLTVTVPASEDSDVDLGTASFTATAADISSPSTTATASASATVIVDAVLDQFGDVSASPVSGAESASEQTLGLGTSLSIADAGFAHSLAGGADTDGSESITVTLVLNAALPTGVTLSSTSGTVTLVDATHYSVSGADLAAAVAGLQVTVPAGFDGTISGSIESSAVDTVSAGSTETDYTDNSKIDSAIFSVTISDGPSVTTDLAVVGPDGATSLKEDVPGQVLLTATPGIGDTVTEITLSGMPAGWSVDTGTITLSNGTVGSATYSGGVLTIAVTGATAGVAVVATVGITPAADSDIDATGLTLSATAVDGAATFTGSSSESIPVDAVLDQFGDVSASPVSGTESASEQTLGLGTGLSIANAGFAHSLAGGADTDGSESITVTLVLNAALPAGVTLSSTAGTVTLVDATHYSVGGTDLAAAVAGLQVTVPAGFDGTISGSIESSAVDTVSAGSTETDYTDNSKTDSAIFSVTISDGPSVTTDLAVVGPEGTTSLKEDVPGQVLLTATPGIGDTVTEITLSGMPAGWSVDTGTIVLSNGTVVGSATYSGGVLTIAVTGATAGVAVVATVGITPAADSDIDATGLTLSATAVDGAATFTGSSSESIPVDAVLDQFGDVSATSVSGTESASVQTLGLGTSLSIADAGFAHSLAGGADTDGSESITVTLVLNAALPTGVTLSSTAGTVTMVDATHYSVSGADLAAAVAGLQVTVPAGFDGTISGSIQSSAVDTVSAGSTETDLTDNSKTDSAIFSVTISDGPSVTTDLAVVGPDGATSLKEDVPGQVLLTATPGIGDTVTEITLSGMPAGWSVDTGTIVLSNGTVVGSATYSGGVLTIAVTGATAGVAVVATVGITPAADSDVDATGLTLSATAVDGAATFTGSSSESIPVDAVLDQFGDVSATSVSGTESASVQTLGLGTSLSIADAGFAHSLAGGADTDGSESITVTLVLNAALPTGVTLSSTAGTVTMVDATHYSVSGADLAAAVAGLQVTVPAGFDGTISGSIQSSAVDTVSAGSTETDLTDNSKTDSAIFSVTISDGPSVTTDLAVVGPDGATSLKEDVPGQVLLTATPGIGDTVTEITLSGMPAGWSVDTGTIVLSNGTVVGSATYSGGVLTIAVTGATAGVAVVATVGITPAADSDVDATGLTLSATAVDGAATFTGSSSEKHPGRRRAGPVW